MAKQKTLLTIVIALCAIAVVGFIGCCGIVGALYSAGDDLAGARSRFRTTLLHEGPAPQEYENWERSANS